MSRTTNWKRAMATAVVAGGSLSAILGASPAQADQFSPNNIAPTLSSPGITLPGAQTSFEPDAGASDEVYAYGVTIGDENTLNDLSSLTVCLYHSLKEDGVTAGEGDSTCAAPNPKHTVKLTWTPSSGAFAMDSGGSSYWALGADADVSTAPSDLTASSGTVTFRFKVSEATREGTWKASASLVDTSAAGAEDASITKAVAGYSSITARTQKSYGTLAVNTGGEATDSPTVVSNGATNLSLTAGNFSSGSYSYSLKADGATSVAPASGQVTFDCMTGGTFTEASATRVAGSATSLGSATSTGTAEGGSAVSNICRLKHGGGRPVATYSFTVVNAVSNV